MAVAVVSFDNPEVMQVPQAGGQSLCFCSGVALVNYAGTGDGWQRDDLVFTVPSEQAGVGKRPPLRIPSFADSVVTVARQPSSPMIPTTLWSGASTTRTASSTATATSR